MKNTYKIMLFMGIYLATMMIPSTLGASADYVGVCPGATLEYEVTKDHFSLGYPTQKWTITITSVEEGVDLVGSKPGMILNTDVTGQNITDLYYNPHIFVYQNQAEEDNQSICTGEIEWVIHKSLGGQNHSYTDAYELTTNIYFDENGVFENGVVRKAEGSWAATYVITRTSIELGNCIIPGYAVEILSLCSILAIGFLILKVYRKKAKGHRPG